MTDARILALETLLDVFENKTVLKSAVEAHSTTLDKRDRAFLMEIVYGVLRQREALDWILKDFLKNPARLDKGTLNNLRIASYQLFFMRVPEWAIVNESVEMEKISGGGRPDLVNAVLRNLLRQRDEIRPPFKIDDPVTNISVNTSHPGWLVKRWVKRFGQEQASLLARANNEIPRMSLRANTLRISREELLARLREKGFSCEPGKSSPAGITLKEPVPYADLSFLRGLFFVQDEASQLISYLLDPKQGERILDACAAPGGKATHIAQLMNDRGEVVAVEREPERTKRLKENVEALGLKSIKVVTADINELSGTEAFDRILLDAPCSAIGVIRRNPDVKYRHSRKDLQDFQTKQLNLLRKVSGLLREGGLLVYSVCSTEPEEGEETVNGFLKTADNFRIISKTAPFLADFMKTGFLRTYPHRDNMDGFFGAVLCRIK